MKSYTTRQKVNTTLLLIFSLFITAYADHSPIEFTSEILRRICYVVLYLSLPVLLVRVIILITDLGDTRLLIMVTTIIAAPILLLVGFASTFCGITTEPLFRHKTSEELIVQRNYGCGAWDSSRPDYQYYRVTPASPLFNIVREFDVANLDTAIWQKFAEKPSRPLTAEESAAEKAALEKAAFEKAKADKHLK